MRPRASPHDDVSDAEALGEIAKTFGSLPKRESCKKNAFAEIEHIAEGSKIELEYRTKDEPRSVAAKLWLSGGRQNMKQMRTANILAGIFDDVMRKDIRENEGKVYSPFAYNNPSTWIKDFGLLTGATFVVPEFNAEILELIEKCAQKTSESISEDEFERAKIPLLKEIEANRRKNVYWLEAVLNLCQAKPENIELAKTLQSGYSAVTVEDVRNAAKTIFKRKPYTLSIKPNADAQ